MPDLFYQLRPVNSELYNNTKNIYNINFPEEMISRLKSICNLNQNEDLTKQFNDRANKLLSDKNMIFIYSIQLNFADLVNKILDASKDERILLMIKLFYLVLHMNDKIQMINDNRFEELRAYNDTEEGWREVKSKIEELVDIDSLDYNINYYVTNFRRLDEEFIKSVNEYAGCLFIYLGKMIEFNIEKINHKQLKDKLDQFFQRIQRTSTLWPIQKRFYESTIIFLNETSALEGVSKKMYNLMEKYEIENPINDYHLERTDIAIYQKDPEICYQKIVANRNLLKAKINRIEKMAAFYCKCLINSGALKHKEP